MTSGRWDILAVENDWHGAGCARRWPVPEPCNCGLLELVVRIEREAAARTDSLDRADTRLDRIKAAISGYKARDGLLGLLVEVERIAYGPLSDRAALDKEPKP